MRSPVKAKPKLNPAFMDLWGERAPAQAPTCHSKLHKLDEEPNDSSDSDDSDCSGLAVRGAGGATGRHYKNHSLSDLGFFSGLEVLTKFFNTVRGGKIPREQLISQKLLMAQQWREQRASVREVLIKVIAETTINEENEEKSEGTDDAVSSCFAG